MRENNFYGFNREGTARLTKNSKELEQVFYDSNNKPIKGFYTRCQLFHGYTWEALDAM